ncbi:BTB/POZ domain-containing protein 17-like isoform X2 [Tubulanus polymorphus]
MAAASFHVNVADAAAAVSAAASSGSQQHRQQTTGERRDDADESPTTPSTKAVFGDGIDCYGDERQMLTDQEKFYNNQVLSDIVLKVGTQRFYAHKLMLIRASDVFERMFSSEWADPDKPEIELVEEAMCVEVFPRFLKFLYSCHVLLNVDTALPLLVLADKYNVIDLQNVCINFSHQHIIPKIQLKDVFHVWFQYATKCYHHKLISASVAALSDTMLSAEWEQEWTNLEQEQLMEFVRSSNLIIKDEYELWEGVLKWLQASAHPDRMVKMETHLRAILPHVRFPMMTADHLSDIQKSRLYELYPLEFQPYIMLAYKFHALSLTSRATAKEFTTEAFLLRNYTNLRWDKRLVITDYPTSQKSSEVTLRFTTRSSSLPTTTWEWELRVNLKFNKLTSSEDFMRLKSTNLILDQARPIEFLLSVVDNEHVITTVTGKKNFCKNKYMVDTEIDKKLPVQELTSPDSEYLVNGSLILQITLKPVS